MTLEVIKCNWRFLNNPVLFIWNVAFKSKMPAFQ